MIVAPSPLSSRNQFGHFLKERKLTGLGVEVGTHRGEFAYVLLKSWPGTLYCVDPWGPLAGYEEQAAGLWGNGDREEDYRIAQRRLAKFTNHHMLRMTSHKALEQFRADSLDFVYIDGDHRPQHVLHDLCNWWAKLKPGGILAGHDFICPGEVNGGWGPGVQLGIQVFFNETHADSDVHLIVEEGGLPWSFYIVKESK
jgi:hypothetical protein